MSVSHCMHHALHIAAQPRNQWASLIRVLPDTCTRADCGKPRSCRERVSEYMRMQWRMRPTGGEGAGG